MKRMLRMTLMFSLLPWTTGCQTDLPPQPLPHETPDDEDDGPDPFPFHANALNSANSASLSRATAAS